MSYYRNLTVEQVTSFYALIKFLRRLKVIGVLEARTIETHPDIIKISDEYDLIDMTNAHYGIVKEGYSPNRIPMLQEELLEKLFGRLSNKLRGSP